MHWLKEKREKQKKIIYKTLHRKLKIDNKKKDERLLRHN
jgi:hypothetical protein